jgi:hypothetical protein
MRPSILRPASVRELPPEVQEAIASHELFHVHRRDWLFVMAEEMVRSVLWFHPAVWFPSRANSPANRWSIECGHGDRAGYLTRWSVAAQRLLPDTRPRLLLNMLEKAPVA